MGDQDEQERLKARLLGAIAAGTPEDLRNIFHPQGAATEDLRRIRDPAVIQDILIAKNIKIFGGDANAYVDDFLNGRAGVLRRLATMPAGPAKDAAKLGFRAMVDRILNVEGLDDAHRQLLTTARDGPLAQGGGKRRKTHRRRRGQKSRRHHK
jgi:hypothetical protein